MENCIFCKIIRGEIACTKKYEDDNMIIFCDISPKAKIHLLAVPKKHYPFLSAMTDDDANILAKCLKKLPELSSELGIQNGYRLIINQGEAAGQTVGHLHIHILAGETLDW